MAHSDPSHVVLWRRVRAAIAAQGIDAGGNPNEIAKRVRPQIGGDQLDRFLESYYLERQYAGAQGRLSDVEAEALVREIETRLATGAPRTAPSPREAAGRPDARPAVAPIETMPALPVGPLEEAEAYGEEEAKPLSLLGPIKAFLRNREERRKEAAAEAERERQRQTEQERLAELRQAREEEERRLRDKEEEERQNAARERAREASEQAHAERLARELEDAEKRRRELEEQRAREVLERRRSAIDRSERAREAIRTGDRSGAIALLEEVSAALPDNAAGWFTLAWAYALDERYRQSTEAYRRGLALEPANKVAWNNLGRDLRRRRRFKESAEALAKALEIDPDYLTARANLGSTLRDGGDHRGAAGCFAAVVGRSPDDSAAWYWLGYCHQQLREYDHAQRAFARAVELDPGIADAWRRMGDCLRALNRRDEAKVAHQRADALGSPKQQIGLEEVGLAVGTFAVSYVGAALASQEIAFATMAVYGLLVWRLRLSRVQLFVISMPAMIALTLPFTEHVESGHWAVAILLAFTAIAGKLWQRSWR